jgi:hypothetical protein
MDFPLAASQAGWGDVFGAVFSQCVGAFCACGGAIPACGDRIFACEKSLRECDKLFGGRKKCFGGCVEGINASLFLLIV